MKIGIGGWTIVLICALCSCSNKNEMVRQIDYFNDNWKFNLGNIELAKDSDFDDSEWRTLTLPHDWAIEGEFSQNNPSGTGGGALPGGIGWYRKSFVMSDKDKDKKIFIDFDGVYMNSEVYLNGHLLGKRPYGYISFRYDLTPFLKWGKKNTLSVKVDNHEQPNSRWYSGCGIYRNVWLTKTNFVHFGLWGITVNTPMVNASKAKLDISTVVKNESKEKNEISVLSIVLDKNGNEVNRTITDSGILPNDEIKVLQSLSISNPILWDVTNPYLYTLRSEIRKNGELIDNIDTKIGIRSFDFNADSGFSLNGKSLKINGVCMHHDLGCLGAAINRRAIERQLQILKEMGCNAIRMSHNPPSPEILDLCDNMGFIVMDESFDMWRKKKTNHDYARYFNEWYEKDLSDLIKRDINHPSIMMWSIGNEVLEQWTDVNADTLSLEQANMILNFGHDKSMLANEDSMSVNSLLCSRLVEIVKNIDKSRPVTSGCNETNPNNHLFKSGALDIIGFNYHNNDIENVKKNFPDKPFIITESNSALMTRGYYRMPSDEMFIWPERWDKPFFDSSFSCSSYDNCHAPWGSTHEETMRIVKNTPFVSGQFVWTGFDYLGEPTPFGWPARSSYFGIVDLAGFPKDIYYMYKAEWTDKDVLHLFPHWNWKQGDMVDMWAYYNNADEIELFVNGVSQGIKRKMNDEYHVSWRVKFVPGSVKAVTRKNGKVVMSKEIFTASRPYAIRLTPDRNVINNDGRDLSFVTVEIIDKDGNICPTADNLVKFAISGSGFIAGVDNGSPISLESFKSPYRKAFNGKCMVVIQNNGENKDIELKATSPNLKDAVVNIDID